MNDVIKKDDIPTTSNLSNMGIRAIAYSAAGIFLFVLNALASYDVFGFIVGGMVLLFGILSFRSKDPADKRTGIIFSIAGALTVLSKMGIPLVSGISSVLMGIGAFGLLALGIWNGVRFFIGLKKRS
jgi:hypothetical protein